MQLTESWPIVNINISLSFTYVVTQDLPKWWAVYLIQWAGWVVWLCCTRIPRGVKVGVHYIASPLFVHKVTTKFYWHHYKSLLTSLQNFTDLITKVYWAHYKFLLTSLQNFTDPITKLYWPHLQTFTDLITKLYWTHYKNLLTSLQNFVDFITNLYWPHYKLYWAHYKTLLNSLQNFSLQFFTYLITKLF